MGVRPGQGKWDGHWSLIRGMRCGETGPFMSLKRPSTAAYRTCSYAMVSMGRLPETITVIAFFSVLVGVNFVSISV